MASRVCQYGVGVRVEAKFRNVGGLRAGPLTQQSLWRARLIRRTFSRWKVAPGGMSVMVRVAFARPLRLPLRLWIGLGALAAADGVG